MNIAAYYVINRKTIVLIPDLDVYGNLITRLLEGKSSFLVNMSPITIIEKNILYYGHDYEGAIEAAKLALGNIDVPAVKISGSLAFTGFLAN